MSKRQNFPANVKNILAQRAGMRCSNPQCKRPTSGPHTNPDKAINLGVACHITAASPKGPRYDIKLTFDERISVQNGIWLCQSCSKLIDTDVIAYSVHILKNWKDSAENEARRMLETPATPEENSLLLKEFEKYLKKYGYIKSEKVYNRLPTDDHTNILYTAEQFPNIEHNIEEHDNLYTLKTDDGKTVNYMVRNKLLMFEIILENNLSMVGDIGVGQINIRKLPYGTQGTKVHVDPKYILSTSTLIFQNGSKVITQTGKWGFEVTQELDANGNLNNLNSQYSSMDLPPPYKVLYLTPIEPKKG